MIVWFGGWVLKVWCGLCGWGALVLVLVVGVVFVILIVLVYLFVVRCLLLRFAYKVDYCLLANCGYDLFVVCYVGCLSEFGYCRLLLRCVGYFAALVFVSFVLFLELCSFVW